MNCLPCLFINNTSVYSISITPKCISTLTFVDLEGDGGHWAKEPPSKIQSYWMQIPVHCNKLLPPPPPKKNLGNPDPCKQKHHWYPPFNTELVWVKYKLYNINIEWNIYTIRVLLEFHSWIKYIEKSNAQQPLYFDYSVELFMPEHYSRSSSH